jgi:hypothetical protein
MAIRIAWPNDELELTLDEIGRKVRAYSAVAAMSPEEFRRLIDGRHIPPRTGNISPQRRRHIPVPVLDLVTELTYATYPPRQLDFPFNRDPSLYRPYPGRK